MAEHMQSTHSWSKTAVRVCAFFCCCWALRPVEADDRMRHVVENVRANEQLYENIEVLMHRVYRIAQPRVEFPTQLKFADGRERCVLQDGLIYLKIDRSGEQIGKKPYRQSTLQGFDGEWTRQIHDDAIANLREGRVVDLRIAKVNPFTILLTRAQVFFPLSIFLDGNQSKIKQQPSFRKRNTRVRFEGEEIIDGLPCVKVRIMMWVDGKAPKEDVCWILWLVPGRNYLPVRMEWHNWELLRGHPSNVARVDDLREIAPGVWFPFHATLTVYDDWWFNEENKLVVSNSEEYTVEKAELDPHYDLSLFRDIPIPHGMPVYVIKGGQITKSYQQGIERPRPKQSTVDPWVPFGAVVLVVVGLAVLVGRVRGRLRSFKAYR